MTVVESHRPAPLEVASGLVLGLDPRRRLPAAAPDPVAALERAIARALRRPPCLVSFSGGRDSSAVLAVAVAVARREGLPPPIPATNRFPGLDSADESSWQEDVVADLRLADWARFEHRGELDLVGPVALRVLRRHGLLWPFNVHFHAPLLEAARGGSLLTGIGGDEVLSPGGWSEALAPLGARRIPTGRELLRVGFELAPDAARRAVLRRRLPAAFPWLRPAARRRVASAWAAQAAADPSGWAAHLGWVRRLRYLRVGTAALGIVAADEDVDLVHPLLDDGFVGALAALPRRRRFRTRADATRALAGDLLPADVLARETKSSFDGAFWNEHSRAFAAGWDGRGVDPALVDADALRAEWLSDAPDPRSFTLLQAAALRAAGRLEQEVERRVERAEAAGTP